MGIVGMPNIGKSFFFNALTNSNVPSENYPFCTIEPWEARAKVQDSRIDKLVEIYRPKEMLSAFLTVIDIAGLVKGASAGAGLGNNFLANIKSVDGIFHLVRAFESTTIEHVEGTVDPLRDMEIIHLELRLKDTEIIEKLLESKKKETKRLFSSSKMSAQDKLKMKELEWLKKILHHLTEKNLCVRQNVEVWSEEEVTYINSLHLLTAKPCIFLINMSTEEYLKKNNVYFKNIQNWVNTNYPGDQCIPYSGIFEAELSVFDEQEEKDMYMEEVAKEFKVKTESATSTLNEIVLAGYNALNLIYYFTCGPQQVRCWTVKKNTKAPQAAAVIHTDFEKSFILAEVIKYGDLIQEGCEENVKTAGKILQKGKDYLVQDGDIIRKT
ncbi:hypothetical protein HDU92_008698 [Lobulomyces angularis]|nr:hypothetical protein HDU92_008698 [Lobulomyces angularis]